MTSVDELNELFFAASSEERRLILLNLPYAPLPAAAPVFDAAARESTLRLEKAALEHNSEAFAREIERTFGVSRALARRLMDDTSGEPIVVVAVALGMPAAVLQRILLCLNPVVSRSVQRVYDLAMLQEEISPDMALRLLAIWQASRGSEKKSTPARPAFQPSQYRVGSRDVPAGPPKRPSIHWDEPVSRSRNSREQK